MTTLSLLLIVSTLLSSFSTGALGKPFTCTNFTVTVDVSVIADQINLATPRNQSQFTGIVQESFSATSNVSELITGTTPLRRSYDIFSSLCLPHNLTEGGVLEFAVHGLNLDHTYWEVGGAGSEFNFVESAISAGHAIFIFDRLGTGLSSTPDGIKEVQTSVHVGVLTSLITKIREGTLGHRFNSIVAVGHSYGSNLLTALVARQGNIVDGMVLTGFSNSVASFPAVFAGLGMNIATEVDSARFRSLDNSYAAIISIVNMQQMFFHFPDFPESVLDASFANRGVFTLGELLTKAETFETAAVNFTGPILVATGAQDFVVCGGNCFQSVNGSPNLLEPARALFPSASEFTTFIPANAGHSNILHFGAAEIIGTIQQWITQHFP